jgi:hypothetical protein
MRGGPAVTRFVEWPAAAGAALLPSRYWSRFERRGIDVAGAAAVSALFTAAPAAVLGARVFLAHVAAASAAANQAVVHIAATQIQPSSGAEITSSVAQVVTVASALTFLLTPVGALTTYLTGAASLRLVGSYLGEPFGDPLLTLLDAAGRRLLGALTRACHRVRQRNRFGPVVADRVVDAAVLGVSGAEVVIVASRPKGGWTPGLMLVSSDGCYLLGTPLCRRIDRRMRILYPLVKKRDTAIVRRSVSYDVDALRVRASS